MCVDSLRHRQRPGQQLMEIWLRGGVQDKETSQKTLKDWSHHATRNRANTREREGGDSHTYTQTQKFPAVKAFSTHTHTVTHTHTHIHTEKANIDNPKGRCSEECVLSFSPVGDYSDETKGMNECVCLCVCVCAHPAYWVKGKLGSQRCEKDRESDFIKERDTSGEADMGS